MADKVRVGSWYIFDPCLLDAINPTGIAPKKGQRVQVVNMPGCPPANTMGHCYVKGEDGTFHGLVANGSLTKTDPPKREKRKKKGT